MCGRYQRGKRGSTPGTYSANLQAMSRHLAAPGCHRQDLTELLDQADGGDTMARNCHVAILWGRSRHEGVWALGESLGWQALALPPPTCLPSEGPPARPPLPLKSTWRRWGCLRRQWRRGPNLPHISVVVNGVLSWRVACAMWQDVSDSIGRLAQCGAAAVLCRPPLGGATGRSA